MSEIKSLSEKASGYVPLYKIAERMDMEISYLPNISVQLYKFFAMLDEQIERNKIEIIFPDMVVSQMYISDEISREEWYKLSDKAEDDSIKGNLILLDKPVLLKAQNSSHKTDFGDEYHQGRCVKTGTKYGDTSGYPIVACLINQHYLSQSYFKKYDSQLKKLLT